MGKALEMWLDTFLNMFTSDVSQIPRDIGNDVLANSNIFVTKNGINKYLYIEEWGDEVDESFLTAVLDYVKSAVPNVEVNCKLDLENRFYNLKDPTIESNIMWMERSLDKAIENTNRAKRIARFLYTRDVVQAGARLFNTQTIFEVRGYNYKDVHRGYKLLCQYLDSQGIQYYKINLNLQVFMPKILYTFDGRTKVDKDIPKTLFSARTLSQTLPSLQGLNSEVGVPVGIDQETKSMYYMDLSGRSAKNIYLLGESGSGKTVVAQYMAIGARCKNCNITISDIKGNEFYGITKAFGGEVISLRPTDNKYINVFRLERDRANKPDYYENMMAYAKSLLVTVIDAKPEDISKSYEFVDEFIKALHIRFGVSKNPTTWRKTEEIKIKELYKYMLDFLSDDIRKRYGNVAMNAETSFKSHFDPRGSMSFLYDVELDYSDLLEKKILCYDFGLLKISGIADPVAKRIKFLFKEVINNDYLAYKFDKYPWEKNIIISEESQIAPAEEILNYKNNITLRRAQNCANILLGNSLKALIDTPGAQAILDNLNIFIIGKVSQATRELIYQEFDFSDRDMDFITVLSTDQNVSNNFFIKDNSKKSISTVIKAEIPPEIMSNSLLFKSIDETQER